MADRPRPFKRRRRARAMFADPAEVLMASASVDTTDGARGFVAVAPSVKLWYRVVGEGPSTIVVPTTGNDVEFEALQVPGHRVLFYDVRRRGRSDVVTDPNRLGFAAEVTDLEAVRQIFGLERFAAVASSYHAGIVATYALQHPDRVDRLVLAAPIPPRAGAAARPAQDPAPHQVARLDQLEASGLRDSDPAAFCRAWREVYIPLLMGDPGAFERLASVCALPNEWPWQVATSMVFVFAQLRSYDWRPHLRDLAVPTMVVHGSADPYPVEVAREWTDSLPSGRLLELDGAGRFPWVERSEAFFGATNRFLAGDPV